MLEATQKKLREAKFFYGLLCQASQEVVRHEPEAFDFYLSAFLSAARSVTFALQYEEKDKYDAWFPVWSASRSEQERELLKFLKEQRNCAEKRGGAEVDVAWEYIPVPEVSVGNRGVQGHKLQWFGPPGAPPPRLLIRR